MTAPNQSEHPSSSGSLKLARWEFNVLLLESILLAGLLFAGVSWLLSQKANLPQPVAWGFGFFVLMWTVVPILTCYNRSMGHRFRILRFAIGSVIAVPVGVLVSWWLFG